MSNVSENQRKAPLSYSAILALTTIGIAGFIAATVITFYFGAIPAGILCLILGILNATRFVILLRMGREGWESRATGGG